MHIDRDSGRGGRNDVYQKPAPRVCATVNYSYKRNADDGRFWGIRMRSQSNNCDRDSPLENPNGGTTHYYYYHY